MPLLHIIAHNYYADPETLTTLTVTNNSTSGNGATQAQLDGQFQQLKLRKDDNGDGLLTDLDTSPPIGQAAFVDGEIRFDGSAATLTGR